LFQPRAATEGRPYSTFRDYQFQPGTLMHAT